MLCGSDLLESPEGAQPDPPSCREVYRRLGFRVPEVLGFRVSEFVGSRFQSFRVQGFRVSGFGGSVGEVVPSGTSGIGLDYGVQDPESRAFEPNP